MRGANRIYTTHAGSLPRAESPRPHEGDTHPREWDAEQDRVRRSVVSTVERQIEIGIDIVSDGEMSKSGFAAYAQERLAGFGGSSGPLMIADLFDFPQAARRIRPERRTTMPACIGRISYCGHNAVESDIQNLRCGVERFGAHEAFVPAASPGVLAYTFDNYYYRSSDDYLAALGEAMRTEYETISAAGFVLQIDAPDLAGGRHIAYADLTLHDFRAQIAANVEVLNETLRNIPPDRVRLHLCWGNYPGPHHRDVELREIIDIVMGVRAHTIVLEAANPRHAHEWKVFEETSLPDDKILAPGVIDTTSSHIEHPGLVAERITRYANLIGRERVIAATDCGFATTGDLATIPAEIAWAKLESLVVGAQRASERLW